MEWYNIYIKYNIIQQLAINMPIKKIYFILEVLVVVVAYTTTAPLRQS